MKKVKFPLGFLFCLIFLFFVFAADAGAQLPSIPHTVKGGVYIDGNPAPVGSTITAKLGNETVSEFNITNEGLYAIGIGVTPENQGETAKLYVNGIETEASVVLKSGEVETVDLFVSTPLGNVWYYVVAVLIVIAVLILVVLKYRRR